MIDNSTDNVAQSISRESHDQGGDGGTEATRCEAYSCPAAKPNPSKLTTQLMEQIVHRDNLNRAYLRVFRNRGAGGVDGKSVDDLLAWCQEHKDTLIDSLLNATYKPQPVRGVTIAKPGGGRRQLGIPTVVDRLVQQAFLQILGPILDSTFSDSSFGFRPRRSAHDALERASEHIRQGHRFVVDLDLEKFFDRVNHDILMSRLARHIKDKRVLKIVRAFLNAGLMNSGVVTPRKEGTPQGGPLSPLLSNLLLDDLDKELESRGHRFARYADDVNIYVQSLKAGQRVLGSVTSFLTRRLKLRVNEEKSAVGPVSERSFLGYRLFPGREPRDIAQECLPF